MGIFERIEPAIRHRDNKVSVKRDDMDLETTKNTQVLNLRNYVLIS